MKLDEMQLSNLLAQLRDGMQAHYGARLRDVRMFGSYARGNANPGSDIDILVLLSDDVDEFVESEATADLVAGLSLEFDTVVCCLFLSEREYRDETRAFFQIVREESISI